MAVSTDAEMKIFSIQAYRFITYIHKQHDLLRTIKTDCLSKHARGVNCLFVPMKLVTSGCLPNQWLTRLTRHFFSYEEYCATIASPSEESPALMAEVKRKIDSYNPETTLLWVISSDVGDVLIYELPVP
jgi:hypothetical protein